MGGATHSLLRTILAYEKLMFGLSFPLVISGLAGLCGGLAIGGLFSTETEMKRRALHNGAVYTTSVNTYMLIRSGLAALLILILTFCIGVHVRGRYQSKPPCLRHLKSGTCWSCVAFSPLRLNRLAVCLKPPRCNTRTTRPRSGSCSTVGWV